MVIVTEWCAGGSLAKSLAAEDATGKRRMAWRARGRLVALGVARGLAYLHSMRVISTMFLFLSSPLLSSCLLSLCGTQGPGARRHVSHFITTVADY